MWAVLEEGNFGRSRENSSSWRMKSRVVGLRAFAVLLACGMFGFRHLADVSGFLGAFACIPSTRPCHVYLALWRSELLHRTWWKRSREVLASRLSRQLTSAGQKAELEVTTLIKAGPFLSGLQGLRKDY